MSFYRPQTIFGPQLVFVSWKIAFFVGKIDFHFIFSEIKNSYAEKSAVFAEFHEFLSSPQKFLDRSFSICPLKNWFSLNQNRLSFYFFWNRKFLCRKKFCFRRIAWVFIVPPNLFWVICGGKSAIFEENMKKFGVCVVSKKCDFRRHLGSN